MAIRPVPSGPALQLVGTCFCPTLFSLTGAGLTEVSRGWGGGSPCSPEGDQFQEQLPHFLSATASRFWKLLSSSPAILAIRSPVGSL